MENKKKKLEELHQLENQLNKENNYLHKRLLGIHHEIIKITLQKKKIAKRISHNMKLRNRIIEELLEESKKSK